MRFSHKLIKGKINQIIIVLVLLTASVLVVISAFDNPEVSGGNTTESPVNESQIKPAFEPEEAADSKPADYNITFEPIANRAFNESAGVFTKRWDARNFEGFWRDEETGASTESLIINQSLLDNDHRVIERHNLIYRTRPIHVNYQVYRHTGKAPAGTEGSYQAIGWMGEKYVFLNDNKLARVIFEQKATEVKIITTGDSWDFEEGYRLFAHSIEAPLERMAWIEFSKDNTKLDEVVIPDREPYRYQANAISTPIFVTYPIIHRGPKEDIGEFMNTWLRSENLTSIKKGDIFGMMEVTSLGNGTIELKNKEPIVLAPNNIINLMGNISIQVGNSSTELLLYPITTQRDIEEIKRTYPSVIETITAAHPVLKNDTSFSDVAKDYDFRDYRYECCEQVLPKIVINAYSKRGDGEENIEITLQNDYAGKERLKTIEVSPWKGGELAFNTIAIGGWSGYKSPAFIVINNRTKWESIWDKHVNFLSERRPSLPDVNFTNQTVVALFSGDSSGFDTELIYISKEGSNIFVNTQKSYPANPSSGQPYFILNLPKTGDNITLRTLKWINKTMTAPTRADTVVEIVSRKYGIQEKRLTLVHSQVHGASVNYRYTWEGVAMDKISGKEYHVYLDDSGVPVE